MSVLTPPLNWVQTSLGDITFPDRPRESPSDYPELLFIGMENVEAHSMKLLGTVPSTTMKSAAVHFREGDVLYGRLRPYLNKVLKGTTEGLCSAEFIVFADYGYVSPSWLAYRLNSSDFVSFAAHLNEGDRPRVDYDQISPFPIDLPPRPEQDRIVAEIEKQFTRLDDAVAALKRVKANLKRYRASVLKTACEGRLVPTEAELARKERRDYEPAGELLKRILAERRAKWEADQLQRMIAVGKQPKGSDWKTNYREPIPPETSKLPALPEGWQWTNVGQLAMVGTGATPKRDVRRFYEGGSIPWVTSGVVNCDVVSAETERVTQAALKETNLTLYPKHTLVLAMYGEGKTRGKVSELLIEATTNQALAALQFEGAASDCRTFVKLALQNNYESIRLGASGGVQPNLNLNIVRAIPIPLAPVSEQFRIVEGTRRILAYVERQEAEVQKQLTHSLSLRQSILRSAFSGKLVPQDPNDEPASVLLERIRSERAALATNNGNQKATPKAGTANGQRRRRITRLAQGVSPGKG